MSATSMVIGFDRGRVQGGRRQEGVRSPRSVADTPLRLTRRGRLVVTLFLTCLIVAAFVVSGGASVATRDGGVAEPVDVVEVEEGQTLWEIAGSVAAPGETGEMVYRIRELNSLPGSTLVEGQELAVPVR